MISKRTLIVLIVVGVVIILLLLFRLYIVSQSINDTTIILIEQVWALREWCLVSTYHKEQAAITWPNDALLIQGTKGELLIRRFDLQRQWARTYKGTNDINQKSIRTLIDNLDDKLVEYGLNLKVITALTEKMVEEVYHNGLAESVRMTKTIVRKIRLL